MRSLFLSLVVASSMARAADPVQWPEITKEAKPWTFWWWMGSAVNDEDLSRELKRFHDAGVGGVHIIPIYGVKGAEAEYIDYLSPKWMDRLNHTVKTARELGMGVDMTTGTGWCFGGPTVNEADGTATMTSDVYEVAQGQGAPVKFDKAAFRCVMAYPESGEPVDLTEKIRPDGSLDWVAPSGNWKLYSISQKPSVPNVKRPAPGGEGRMLNLLQTGSIDRYLERFDAAFRAYKGEKPRAMYHDSYEYNCDWSPTFLHEFEKRRDYKLQNELPAFLGKIDDKDRIARVKADYRETVSDLLLASLNQWREWSHQHNFIVRNQSHGSPGNWLDLYAAADIPETEMFHTDRDILISKFASSAAHVTGKNLVSAETGTWLSEHFTETLSEMKSLQDDMFLAGVNHIFYHGAAYSPDSAAWPGWTFYAATQMNHRNPIWHDVATLNAYAARCQAVLQSGVPDNDILLYWPISDQWHDADGTMQPMSVHKREWFAEKPIGKLAKRLWNDGYAFDYISDRQLFDIKVDMYHRIQAGAAAYRKILVPHCEHMPIKTLERLIELAKGGADVCFEDRLPADVSGLTDLAESRNHLNKLRNGMSFSSIKTGPIDSLLKSGSALQPEALSAAGLQWIRRSTKAGTYYFIVNRSGKDVAARYALNGSMIGVSVLNPMTGTTRVAPPGDKIDLNLANGESCIVIVSRLPFSQESQPVLKPTGDAVSLTGTWHVHFLEGGPEIPADYDSPSLGSWAARDDAKCQAFGGTAVYSLTFDAPATQSDHWQLDLGKVCHSARLKLNGKELGTLIAPPFHVTTDALKPTGNVLEIEVTGTAANRIRDMDKRGVKWKIMNDTNVVNIDYKPFDASQWSIADEGLLGPVTVQALK